METAKSVGGGFGILTFLLSGLVAYFLFDYSVLKSAAVAALIGTSLGLLVTCLWALRTLLSTMNLLDD